MLDRKSILVGIIVGILYGNILSSCQEDDDDNTEKEEVAQAYKDYVLATSHEEGNGWTGRVSDCAPGDMSKEVRERALKRWNYIRRLAGYKRELSLDEALSLKSQKAALIMKANHLITHNPTTDLDCYTEEGRETAAFNLSFSLSPRLAGATYAVLQFLEDAGAGNKRVGHRAWLLHPKVKEAAIAGTDFGTVLGWNDLTESADDPAALDEENPLRYVSWPPQGMVMDTLVYERWSFHYIQTSAQEKVEDASVTMKKRGRGKGSFGGYIQGKRREAGFDHNFVGTSGRKTQKAAAIPMR